MILEERYLLPLTIRDGVWEPVIPDAPQIRRMENGGYLFPDIYRSLTETGESWNAQTPAGGEEGSGQIVIPEEEAVSMLTELIEGK